MKHESKSKPMQLVQNWTHKNQGVAFSSWPRGCSTHYPGQIRFWNGWFFQLPRLLDHHRIWRVQAALIRVQICLWNRREISLGTKSRVYQTVVRSILYGSHTCPCIGVRHADKSRLEAFYNDCLRRMFVLIVLTVSVVQSTDVDSVATPTIVIESCSSSPGRRGDRSYASGHNPRWLPACCSFRPYLGMMVSPLVFTVPLTATFCHRLNSPKG